MNFAVDIFLFILVAILGVMAFRRSPALFRDGAKAGAFDFARLVPRLAIGVLGSGYLAEIMPQQLVAGWLGPNSGFIGTLIASIAGALTPGGPVVGFALGAAALKGGAGAPQVIAYATAWALFAIQRLFIWEMPSMPTRVVWIRVIASLPLPFLAAAAAMLVGRP
jgi:uncharacterized membrane protein YraQ (UPF0718 family)